MESPSPSDIPMLRIPEEDPSAFDVGPGSAQLDSEALALLQVVRGQVGQNIA